MKCNNCGTIMELYKLATHLHYTERRYRCNICGYEDANQASRKMPKPIIEEPKKDKK